MHHPHDARSAIDAAEFAAAEGDYDSAEQFLRQAAGFQEAEFGPVHPSLASTLNNLGVVCEIRNKPTDAERSYRRAYAIATAVLAPDDPFAATCRKNLMDFCDARGISSESPPATPIQAVEQQPAAPTGVRQGQPHLGSLHPGSVLVPFQTLSSPFRVIAVSLCGFVLVMLTATGSWLVWRSPTDVPAASPLSSPPAIVVAPAPGRVEPAASSKTVVTDYRGRASGAGSQTNRPPAAPTVSSVRLCTDLSRDDTRDMARDWRCSPASRPVRAGALFFYTRLKSPRDTTVQHRWYHGDHLYQAVDLRIRANQVNGYRTYSRYTVNSENAGDWRVELRSGIGTLLHQERFVVR